MKKREIAQKLNEIIDALNELSRWVYSGVETRSAKHISKIEIPSKKKKRKEVDNASFL
jgi:hypothetical protein